MKLENAKELQNTVKSNQNKIPRGRLESKEQKSALENMKLLFESQKVVIKLFNDYSLIASEAKHKAKYGEGLKMLSLK